VFRPFDHVGSTAEVDFSTTKDVYPADEERSHVNFVVLDGPTGNTWERAIAQAIEALPNVAAYVKNDHLGFTIPYTHAGRSRQYLPDFLVRLRDPGDGGSYNLIVEVSGGHKPPGPTQEKAQAARGLWVPAMNNHGGFGRWTYCEITDPTRAKQDLTQAIDALYRGLGLSAAA